MIKREADNSVKHGKHIIQTFAEFQSWAKEFQTNSQIQIFTISDADLDAAKNSLATLSQDISSISSTMQVHSVIGIGVPYHVIVRNLSCCCDKCVMGKYFDCPCDDIDFHPKVEVLKKVPPQNEDVIVLKADDEDYENFYLFKVHSLSQLTRKSRDDCGNEYKRGTNVIHGSYFSKVDSRINYQELSDSQTFVPVKCCLFALPRTAYAYGTFNDKTRIVIKSDYVFNIKTVLKLDQ